MKHLTDPVRMLVRACARDQKNLQKITMASDKPIRVKNAEVVWGEIDWLE